MVSAIRAFPRIAFPLQRRRLLRAAGLSALASHRACHFGLKQMPPSLTRDVF